MIGGLQKKMKSFQKSKLGSILLCEDVIAEVCTQSAKSCNVPERSTAKAWGTSFPLASDSLLRTQVGKKKEFQGLICLSGTADNAVATDSVRFYPVLGCITAHTAFP